MTAGELALRSLHLKLYPIPKTFSQNREVLRTISDFGNVSMFRSLKYHPVSPVANAFLVIFHTTTAAQAALDASPIRYRIIPSHSSSSVLADTASSASKTTAADSDELEFILNISPTAFSHERFLHSRITNPLHGRFFPRLPHLSLIGSALSQYISQNSLCGAGLLDWDTDRGRVTTAVRNTRLTKTPRTMAQDMTNT